jgi:multicomponent Na+:H+ antiporter subunit D
MNSLPALVVAVPLLVAALIMGGDHAAPRLLQNAFGLAGSAATCVLGVLLMFQAERHEVVHWFGGWRPRSGVSLGIDFAVDPLGGALCAFVGLITFAAIAYSIVYMPQTAKLYDALLLVCAAAMCGFAISGDVFNLFVWLELMGVAAYALTGFEVRRIGPLQGAINFAVVNAIGGFFVVLGIALVYARTGALNLAQIGRTLSGQHGGGVVIVAMALIFCGFMCKGAIVPFHFWLADAYAVAPAPVCLVFAGAMTDIGLLGVARTWFVVFDAPFGTHQRYVGDALLWLGIVTALLGGLMAFFQRHLKRMLAYSVICHIGIMLAGIALLSSKGLAGAGVMLLAHGLLTGGLFLAAGIVFVLLRTIDELELRRRVVRLRWLAVIWFAGAVALAGPPYVGVYLGHALIDEAASDMGRHWVQPLLWLAGAISSAALLRAGARVFLGWGGDDDPMLWPPVKEEPLTERSEIRVLPLALITAALVVLGIVISVVPGIAQRAEYGADRFRDRAGYADRVLHGIPMKTTAQLPFTVVHTTLESILYGVGATLLALAVAAYGLYRHRLTLRLRPIEPALVALKRVHSGVVGDYVMWVVLGTALLGGVWAIGLR